MAGYFGAGIGILTLSALALLGMKRIHGMNAVKTIIASLINLVAIGFFLAHDWGLTTATEKMKLPAYRLDAGDPDDHRRIIGGYLGRASLGG